MAATAKRTRRLTVSDDPKDPVVGIYAKVRRSNREVYKAQRPSGNAWLENMLEQMKKKRQKRGKK